MNKFAKLAVLCTAVTSLGLVACQSNTTAMHKDNQSMKHKEHHQKNGKHGEKHGRMTEEQRKAFDAQVQQVCANNLGKTVSFNIDNKPMQGTCDVRFKPNLEGKEALFSEKMGEKKDKMKHPSKMTEAERAEHEKMRVEHEQQRLAMQTQMQQACVGKVGQKVTLNLNGKAVEGTCEMTIKPERPSMPNNQLPPPPATQAN